MAANPRPRRIGKPDPALILTSRYRALLGTRQWHRLPAAIRQRFSRELIAGDCQLYRGEVVLCRLSRLGRLLAHATRLIGGLLPLENQTTQPSVVAVTKDLAGDGQFWSRQYARRTKAPQVVSSVKRFAGPTGLVEQFGAGVGLALKLRAAADRLDFVGDYFFVHWFNHYFRLPRWLIPLAVTVSHIDRGEQEFAFELCVGHRWLGPLIHQYAIYREL